MRKYLSEVAYLLGDDVRVMPFLVLMFVVVSLIDVVGIGLIAPYVSILIDPELVSSYVELPVGGLGDNAIVWLGILLVSVFFVKFVLAITIHYKIISFAKKQQIRLVSILMNKYQSMPYGVYVERNSSEYIYSIRNLVGQFTGGVVVPGLKIVIHGSPRCKNREEAYSRNSHFAACRRSH